MTVTEASKQLGVSRMTLYNWEDKGKITINRVGRTVDIPEEEVAKRLEELQHEHYWQKQNNA